MWAIFLPCVSFPRSLRPATGSSSLRRCATRPQALTLGAERVPRARSPRAKITPRSHIDAYAKQMIDNVSTGPGLDFFAHAKSAQRRRSCCFEELGGGVDFGLSRRS